MSVFKPWNSIRVKMSILSTVVLGAILILYSVFLFFQLREVLYRNLDAELEVKAHELGKTIKAFQETKSPGGDIHYAALKVLKFDVSLEDEDSVTLADRQWSRLTDRYNLDQDFIAVYSLEGSLLAASGNVTSEILDQFQKILENRRRISSTRSTIEYQNVQLRVLQMMMFARDKPHYLIQIATPLTKVNKLLQNRLWGIALSIPVVMILFGVTGLIFANHILRPVRSITETAERLTHEDLSRRVEVRNVDTEMRFLVKAFNQMIGRLENSFRDLSGIASHIAHELKTPLAIIRGEAQTVLRGRTQTPEQYRAVIESSLKETERMLRVIDDLLIITNMTYDKKVFRMRPVRLVELLTEVHQKSQILAEPKRISVLLIPPSREIVVKADAVHLRRMLYNFIDNAVKYSPAGSEVRIDTERKADGVFISVRDQGEGILKKDLSSIFEYSFQKNPDRRTASGKPLGAGLGLHLCRAIAEAHNGRIFVESEPGKGSTFSVFLPA